MIVPASMITKEKGPVHVVGSARNVWIDLASSPYPGAPCIAVNDSGIYTLHTEHWVTMHPSLFDALMPARKYHRPQSKVPILHTWKKPSELDCVVWNGEPVPNTSGCFAVMIAIALGYSPIIICGIPLSDDGRFHDPYAVPRSGAYAETNKTWKWLQTMYAHRIFAMSGRTMELFGRPKGERAI